jgi:hypothetical protein
MKNYFIVFVFVVASNMIWGQCQGYGITITDATCSSNNDGSVTANIVQPSPCACAGPWRYVLCNSSGTPISDYPSSTTYTSLNSTTFSNLPVGFYQMKFVTASFPSGCSNLGFWISQPDTL